MKTFYNKSNKKKSNSKGFTLVELLVTIGVMGVLIAVVTGSISIVYKARSKTAANKISSLLSQCKINSMSGSPNEFELKYDDAKKTYIATLTKIGETEPYKTEEIGNHLVEIKAASYDVKTNKIGVRYSTSSGAITDFKVNGSNISTPLPLSFTITVSFSRTYNITLYKLTGEHEMTVA